MFNLKKNPHLLLLALLAVTFLQSQSKGTDDENLKRSAPTTLKMDHDLAVSVQKAVAVNILGGEKTDARHWRGTPKQYKHHSTGVKLAFERARLDQMPRSVRTGYDTDDRKLEEYMDHTTQEESGGFKKDLEEGLKRDTIK